MFRLFFVLAFGIYLASSFGAPLPANQNYFGVNALVKLDSTNLNTKINDLEKKIQDLTNRMDGATVQCVDRNTSWQPRSDASIMYLDRQNVACPPSYFLARFRLGREGDYNSARVRYYYKCCKFVI